MPSTLSKAEREAPPPLPSPLLTRTGHTQGKHTGAGLSASACACSRGDCCLLTSLALVYSWTSEVGCSARTTKPFSHVYFLCYLSTISPPLLLLPPLLLAIASSRRYPQCPPTKCPFLCYPIGKALTPLPIEPGSANCHGPHGLSEEARHRGHGGCGRVRPCLCPVPLPQAHVPQGRKAEGQARPRWEGLITTDKGDQAVRARACITLARQRKLQRRKRDAN